MKKFSYWQIVSWLTRRQAHLPVDDIAPENIRSGKPYLLQCPCDTGIARQVDALANEVYEEYNPPFNQTEGWRIKNRFILASLINDMGEVVGYFDILPLKASFAKLLINGQVAEEDITHEDVLAPDEVEQCYNFYLGGVAVKNSDKHSGRRSASVLLWGLMHYLQQYCLQGQGRMLLATGATREGEELLKRFCFRLLSPKFGRKDELSLYAIQVSKQFLEDQLNSLPDWEALCELSWRHGEFGKERFGARITVAQEHVPENQNVKTGTENMVRTKVFISYNHRDKDWLERLRIHLKPIERDYALDIWDDNKIKPGAKWQNEIKNVVESARVAILLVSADFLASDFITANELPPLLKAAEQDGAIILPLILSPSRFLKTKVLCQFQAVNDPATPLISLSRGEQETILVRLAETVESYLQSQEMQEQVKE